MTPEERLAAAIARRDAAREALSPKQQDAWNEYQAAERDLLVAEREAAAANGDEYAAPLDFPVRWDIGAPLPQLLVNDYRALLLFCIRVGDPAWDGTTVTVKDAASPRREPLALVEFQRCIAAKLGAPNDEVFDGHPLSGKGLEPYRAQTVESSRWLAELRAINRVHRGYRDDAWQRYHHYIFWFHDTTFECIAEGFTLAQHTCSMSDLLALAARRLVE